MNSLFNPDISTMRALAEDAAARMLDHEAHQPVTTRSEVPTTQVVDSLLQFFTVLENIDTAEKDVIAAEQVSEITDYGLRVLDELRERSNAIHHEETKNMWEQLSIPLAIWAARHRLPITELEMVINALTIQANRSQESATLVILADIMSEIIETVSPTIRSDVDRSNPRRPWRVINLNHGIVATRCGDPQRMEAVFEQLLYRLPEDAPGFFDEGMRQMDIIGYPAHVRAVMEKYYRRTHKPTLH